MRSYLYVAEEGVLHFVLPVRGVAKLAICLASSPDNAFHAPVLALPACLEKCLRQPGK